MNEEEIFTRNESCCDYLTGLVNRRGLYEYYNSLNKEDLIHAMFIDIDNFKRVNDIYGHSMGDQLLVATSKLIQQCTQAFASRIGGDEYVILFEGHISHTHIISIAETMLAELPNIDFRKDILSLISLSIGIVLDQNAAQPLDDILSKCDAAMYQAKYDGKNRYTIYRSYDKTIEINRNIELEMEKALKSGEFVVFLQPKVNMITSELYGAEALSRWNHPVDGIRNPDLYIPLFEKNGFISRLDFEMFRQVCQLKASWKGRKYEHIPISINMSRLHLYDKLLPDKLEDIARTYGIDTKELELEITESTFIKDSVELIKMVDLLREKGFMVSIDDFGSGFSALNLLKDLPVDTIKLDKEFLQVSSNTTRGKKVIRNVIQLCRDLKMDVVTEGIETKEQVNFITSCGCQIGQGFFYAKPLPVSEFLVFAEEFMHDRDSSHTFHFDGNLLSDDGSLKASISGEGITFEQGIFRGSKSLHFPGGPLMTNLVQVPPAAIVNDSYTVSLWVKVEKHHSWTAAVYTKFESGFFGIIPFAWEGHSSFRIRDSKEVNGWYDVSAMEFPENRWVHVVASYNAKTETAYVYLNGEIVNTLENVPTNRYVKQILIGGDPYQPSLVGSIDELVIYNEPKDFDFIHHLHQTYVTREDFIAFDIDKDVED